MSSTLPYDELLTEASLAASQSDFAVLCTVDADGFPHARFMGCVFTQDCTHVLTLTSPSSRKIEHLRVQPRVEWMLHTVNYETVIHFRGTARVLSHPEELKGAWHHIPDKRKAFFLRYETEGVGFAVIETVVDEIELVQPQRNVRACHKLSAR